MQYRKFGMLDWEVSALGFGAMRLPLTGGYSGAVDEAEAIRMIRYAIDHGVNYVDSAYMYHGGESEVVVGKALGDGYRERVRLATKMPVRLIESRDDMDRIFREQLTRLQTDHVDFYLLHGLERERWLKVKGLGVLDWAEKQIAEGMIRNLGFSFHDEYDVLKDIVDATDMWTLCQVQYNYMDTEFQAGTRGVRYAASKGLAVVVMEPIKGGRLAVKPPQEIQAIWDEAETRRSPAEWALQWVWNQPEVSVALSGMSTMEQVMENVTSADRSGPRTLTEKDLEILAKVREKYLGYGFIGCTSCRYCVPCPNSVAIPEIFALSNELFKRSGDSAAEDEVKNRYLESVPPESRADVCAECGECEEKCPQKLPIRSLLQRAARSFR